MQLKGFEFFQSKLKDPDVERVKITGSADFVFVTWCAKNGALGSALFLNEVMTDPHVLCASTRHQWIQRMYSLDYSQVDIAHMLGVSQALVSRVCREVLLR
jgi:hypothetical protein